MKEKIEKRWTRARHAYALGGRRAPARAPRGQGAKKTPLGAPPSREKIVISQSTHRPSSRTWVHRPNTTLSLPLILSLFPMPATSAPQLLPYLERLLDGETVEWKTLGEVCDIVKAATLLG